MADFFMDTDAGSDANNGTTWALAKVTLEGLFAVMSAGDNGWIQGAAVDTAAVGRTLTSPGTIGTPCILTGVVDGTTNEPPILADLAVARPKIECTGAASDLNFEGHTTYNNIHLESSDFWQITNPGAVLMVNGMLSYGDRINIPDSTRLELISSVLEPKSSTSEITPQRNSRFIMRGGSMLFTVAADIFRSTAQSLATMKGVDLSGLTLFIQGASGDGADITLSNCKMPAVFSLYETTPSDNNSKVTVIASSSVSSIAATDSIQDFQYEDPFGTIDAEFTVVRTGGADDGASGLFSYAMTARADSTLESSSATLKSPWIKLWIEAGSQTLTIFIANSTASTDYNEDEVWVEFYSPDSADTAQHEQNFDPGNARLFASSTAITDDTGSTWGTGGNNHQKLSVAVTPGFEGPAYARLHLAKRQATPDTLYLDPVIEIT